MNVRLQTSKIKYKYNVDDITVSVISYFNF